MRASSKILLIVGLAAGYVLGARAGRERYDQIAEAVSGFWNSPRVQKQVDRSVDFVNSKAEHVADLATSGAKNVVRKVTGGASDSTAQVKGGKATGTKTKSADSTPASRPTTSSKKA